MWLTAVTELGRHCLATAGCWGLGLNGFLMQFCMCTVPLEQTFEFLSDHIWSSVNIYLPPMRGVCAQMAKCVVSVGTSPLGRSIQNVPEQFLRLLNLCSSPTLLEVPKHISSSWTGTLVDSPLKSSKRNTLQQWQWASKESSSCGWLSQLLSVAQVAAFVAMAENMQIKSWVGVGTTKVNRWSDWSLKCTHFLPWGEQLSTWEVQGSL